MGLAQEGLAGGTCLPRFSPIGHTARLPTSVHWRTLSDTTSVSYGCSPMAFGAWFKCKLLDKDRPNLLFPPPLSSLPAPAEGIFPFLTLMACYNSAAYEFGFACMSFLPCQILNLFWCIDHVMYLCISTTHSKVPHTCNEYMLVELIYIR